MMRKGQGALEYLMTYGWALLVVVVVGAALYSLGVLNPGTYAKQACTGFTYFNAREFRMDDGGNFTIIVDNGPYRINFVNFTIRVPGQAWIEGPGDGIISGGASCDPGATIGNCADSQDGNVGPNERHMLNISNQVATELAGNSGAPYTFDIRITYDTVDIPGHQDMATCTGKYEAQ